MQEYIFIASDKKFSQLFARKKTKLRKILPFATKIEHFGSTAVPGLGGKGVLDIYVLISKDKAKVSKKKLIKSGYSFYNIKEMDGGLKMIFRKAHQYGDKIRKVNLHVGTVGIKDFEKCIAFRERLRSDKNPCREYEKAKKLAIKKTKNSGEDSKENARIYVEEKGVFIRNNNK